MTLSVLFGSTTQSRRWQFGSIWKHIVDNIRRSLVVDWSHNRFKFTTICWSRYIFANSMTMLCQVCNKNNKTNRSLTWLSSRLFHKVSYGWWFLLSSQTIIKDYYFPIYDLCKNNYKIPLYRLGDGNAANIYLQCTIVLMKFNHSKS